MLSHHLGKAHRSSSNTNIPSCINILHLIWDRFNTSFVIKFHLTVKHTAPWFSYMICAWLVLRISDGKYPCMFCSTFVSAIHEVFATIAAACSFSKLPVQSLVVVERVHSSGLVASKILKTKDDEFLCIAFPGIPFL